MKHFVVCMNYREYHKLLSVAEKLSKVMPVDRIIFKTFRSQFED